MNFEKLERASSEISFATNNYIFQFGDEDLTNIESFDFMKDWLEVNYSVLSKYGDILKHGYKINLNETRDYYFVVNGNDNETNIIKLFLNSESDFNQNKPSFLEYLFLGIDNYNIVLFGYKNTQNCFYQGIKNKEGIFSFFDGVKPVNSSDRKEIINSLKLFEKKIFTKNSNSLYIGKKNIFFKIKNNNLSLLCKLDEKDKRLKELEQDLHFFLDSIKLKLPNRGVFSISGFND